MLYMTFISTLAGVVIATVAVIELLRVKKKLGGLEHEINSRLTQLLELTRQAAMAVGRQQGIDEERSRITPLAPEIVPPAPDEGKEETQ